MLIRVSSGAGGIVEYLEKGQKKDRWFDRDELDERIILEGDLNRLQSAIDTVDDDKTDKYFHYTLSFKEQYISQEQLHEITSEFKQFITAAYYDEELEFYAEAHIPKIKSYTDKDGTIIERYPHIHVIVPKINLHDGNVYDPLIKNQMQYLDVFQELTNQKYGLASPKDNLRDNFTSSSEIISRYKHDLFTGKNVEIKQELLGIILNNNIASQKELFLELEKQGFKVKLRNSTKPEQSYINITLQGETKGINLKEAVFRDTFLELSKEQKLQMITKDSSKTYKEASEDQQKIDVKYQNKLHEWQTYKSLEIRYIPLLNKNERTKYKNFTLDEKIDYLNNLHAKNILNTQNNEGTEHERIGPITEREQSHLIRKVDRDLERLQQNIKRIGITEPNARERIRQNAARSNSREYRADFELSKQAKRASNATEQLNNDNQTKQSAEKHEVRITELNSLIKADVLLELAQKTHGINPDIYEINVDKNGFDRIKCGTRNLNIIDFATKEMNLTFKEAIPYLKNVLNAQNDIYRSQKINTDGKKYLHDEYQKWFEKYKNSKSTNLSSLYSEYKFKREEIISQYTTRLQKIKTDTSLSQKQKQFEFAILKSQKILELKALDKANKHNQEIIKSKFNTDMRKSYQVFLLEKVAEGDDEALAELRRLKIKFEPPTNSITSLDKYHEFKLNIRYNVDEHGTIRYQINDTTIIEDEGNRINVKQGTEDNIKLSLELSMNKFGNKLTLDGDISFRKRVVETAIKNNMKVEFLDEFSKNYQQEITQKLIASTETINAYNQQALEQISDQRIQYMETKQFDIIDEHNKVKSVNLHYFKDLDSGKIIPLQNKYVDYLHKNNDLEAGVIFDAKKDSEQSLKRSKESQIKKEIKADILEKRLNSFTKSINEKHQSTIHENEYHGVFIKLDKTKYGKEYAVIKTADGFTKFNKPEFINSIKQLNLKGGDLVNITHVKTDPVSKTKQKSVAKYKNLSKLVNYDSLQLIADLEIQHKGKVKKECLGEVIEIREFNRQNSKLYRTVLRDQDNQLQVLYLDSKDNLKVGDFSYIRQTYNKTELVDLTPEYKKMITQSKIADNVDAVESTNIATLVQYGYRQIRNKDVFFAEFKSFESDGSIKHNTKYGEQIKNDLMNENITPGTHVLISNTVEDELYIEQQPIVESIHLDKDIQIEIDGEYQKLVEVGEVIIDAEQSIKSEEDNTEIEL